MVRYSFTSVLKNCVTSPADARTDSSNSRCSVTHNATRRTVAALTSTSSSVAA